MRTQLCFKHIQQNGGQLALQGNPEGVVYLTHWGPQPSGWGGIIASGASSRVTLTNVVADAGGEGKAPCAGGLSRESADLFCIYLLVVVDRYACANIDVCELRISPYDALIRVYIF